MTKEEMAAVIKATVAACETVEDLDRFMFGYVVGTAAGYFVDAMTTPGQRAAWVAEMRRKYPFDFGHLPG